MLQQSIVRFTRKFVVRMLCAILFSAFASEEAVAAQFRAALDRNTTSVGESVTLSLTIEDATLKSQPQLPQIPGIQVGGVSASQNISIINGKTTQQTTYDYVLVPTQQGEITIPAITAVVGNQTVSTQPLKLKVSQRPVASASGPEDSPAEAMLKLVVPKNEMFIGEIMPVEVKLYYQAARDAHLPQVAAPGFTVSQMPQRPEQTQTQIDGQTYNVATFRFSVSPAKSGNMTLGPATVSIVLLSDPRRDFFGGLTFSRSRQVTLSSESAPIQVLPMPTANKPAHFNGAIGQFSMNVSAGPTAVSVGDPITVKIEIEGRGALEPLKLPEQPAWREFRTYPPNSNVETTDPLGLEGKKTFELVVSPQNAGIKELPGFKFSYFDPEQKAYQTITSASVPLEIQAGAATPQPTVLSASPLQQDEEQGGKEIVHIKPQLGTLIGAERLLIHAPSFWLLAGAVPALWLGTLVYRRQKERLENNPRLRRQKQAEAAVREGLQQMKEQAAANKAEEFFATLFRVLQEQIGERLDVPASSITEAVVEEELRPRGLDASTQSLLHELFQTCNQARYAPVRGSQELASFIPRTEQALEGLKNIHSARPFPA